MIYNGMQVTLHTTRRALDPEILPPNLGQLSELSAHHNRSHPPEVRCGTKAVEGNCFYLDFTHVRGAELEVAVLVSVLGINPVTGGLATLALSVEPQNYLYFAADVRQPRRNRYLDGWVIPEIQMVNQFFWTQRGGSADLVADRLGLLVPFGLDTKSNMISVAVFTAVGQVKGAFTSPTRGGGAGVGAGGLIHQSINLDCQLALHGELALCRWNSQPEVTFVWEVDVTAKTARPHMGPTGFFQT